MSLLRQSSILEQIDLALSPLEVARGLRGLGGLIFLDSSASPGPWAGLSILAARPTLLLEGSLHCSEDRQRLRQHLGEARVEVDTAMPQGGLMGCVGFEGDFLFGDYEELLVYDHVEDQWWERGALSQSLEHARSSSGGESWSQALDFQADSSKEHFLRSVEKAKEYIAAGDIYQVNLAHRFSASWPEGADPLDFYTRLREVSPVPYAAYLELGGRCILSASPECFLKMGGSSVSTRPIKGTRPRFRDPDLDQKSAYDLLTSPKEIAELVMITDLERNDLGQICELGSVRTEEFLKLEAFEQVYHRVSTVSGNLRSEVDHVEALSQCSPGGSISGAPKKRALEIIEELEIHDRGLYTGSIGYLGRNGESQFSIAIRTAVIEEGQLRFHVGSGIVADSDPLAEYEETLHKARGFLEAAYSKVFLTNRGSG